jgi:hypothetical protein
MPIMKHGSAAPLCRQALSPGLGRAELARHDCRTIVLLDDLMAIR